MEENKDEKKVNSENVQEKQDTKQEEKKTEKVEPEIKKEVKKEEKPKQEKTEKDDAKFKKVEGTNKEPEKNKSHKVLKAILILIGIIVVLYFIFAMRNAVILNDIISRTGTYKNIDNYTYQVVSKTGDTELNITCLRMGNIERLDIKNESDARKNVIAWKNYDTNEGILAFPGNNTAVLNNANSINFGQFPIDIAFSGNDIIGLGLTAFIYSENLNGKDCYVITVGEDSKIWIEKDTGLVLKKQYNDKISVECISFEEDSVKEIYKPDLTGYEITQQ